MNDVILSKVDEIVDCIKKSSEFKSYLKLKEEMKNHILINQYIDRIKSLQKEIVYNKSREYENDLLIKDLSNKLYDIPLYREYINTIDSINNALNVIENTLNNYFIDKFN